MWIKFKNVYGMDAILNTDRCSSISIRPYTDTNQIKYWEVVAALIDSPISVTLASFLYEKEKERATGLLDAIYDSLGTAKVLFNVQAYMAATQV